MSCLMLNVFQFGLLFLGGSNVSVGHWVASVLFFVFLYNHKWYWVAWLFLRHDARSLLQNISIISTEYLLYAPGI